MKREEMLAELRRLGADLSGVTDQTSDETLAGMLLQAKMGAGEKIDIDGVRQYYGVKEPLNLEPVGEAWDGTAHLDYKPVDPADGTPSISDYHAKFAAKVDAILKAKSVDVFSDSEIDRKLFMGEPKPISRVRPGIVKCSDQVGLTPESLPKDVVDALALAPADKPHPLDAVADELKEGGELKYRGHVFQVVPSSVRREGDAIVTDVKPVMPKTSTAAPIHVDDELTTVDAKEWQNLQNALGGWNPKRVPVLGNDIPEIKSLADVPLPAKISSARAAVRHKDAVMLPRQEMVDFLDEDGWHPDELECRSDEGLADLCHEVKLQIAAASNKSPIFSMPSPTYTIDPGLLAAVKQAVGEEVAESVAHAVGRAFEQQRTLKGVRIGPTSWITDDAVPIGAEIKLAVAEVTGEQKITPADIAAEFAGKVMVMLTEEIGRQQKLFINAWMAEAVKRAVGEAFAERETWRQKFAPSLERFSESVVDLMWDKPVEECEKILLCQLKLFLFGCEDVDEIKVVHRTPQAAPRRSPEEWAEQIAYELQMCGLGELSKSEGILAVHLRQMLVEAGVQRS